ISISTSCRAGMATRISCPCSPARQSCRRRWANWPPNSAKHSAPRPPPAIPSRQFEMASETLHFENARQAQQLVNSDPRNLQALEEHLCVKATSREGWIKLEGPAEAVERARQLFQLLEGSLKAGSPVRNREFAYALNVVKNEGATALKSLFDDRIQTSAKKAAVTPKTVGQKKYLEAIRQHDLTFGIGPAGTGKTYLAMAMAVQALKDEKVSRIVLTRPAVEAGEALGFLPGDLYEKIAPYLRPLHDALHDMLPAEEIQKHMERGTIEVAPLAYMRGRTLNNAFIILDEEQNSTSEQTFLYPTALVPRPDARGQLAVASPRDVSAPDGPALGGTLRTRHPSCRRAGDGAVQPTIPESRRFDGRHHLRLLLSHVGRRGRRRMVEPEAGFKGGE